MLSQRIRFLIYSRWLKVRKSFSMINISFNEVLTCTLRDGSSTMERNGSLLDSYIEGGISLP